MQNYWFFTESYSDAIPLDLLKSEQKDIAKKLAVIDHDIKMHNATFEEMLNNLRAALDIVEDCGVTYRKASPHIKRLLNQAIFAKFNLYGDDDLEAEPQLISPFQENLSVADKKEQKNSYSAFSDFFNLKSTSKNLLVVATGLEEKMGLFS